MSALWPSLWQLALEASHLPTIERQQKLRNLTTPNRGKGETKGKRVLSNPSSVSAQEDHPVDLFRGSGSFLDGLKFFLQSSTARPLKTAITSTLCYGRMPGFPIHEQKIELSEHGFSFPIEDGRPPWNIDLRATSNERNASNYRHQVTCCEQQRSNGETGQMYRLISRYFTADFINPP